MTKVVLQETLVKYLAGLLDADGSLSFRFNQSQSGYTVNLILTLTAAESIDKDGKFCKSLPDITSFGTVRHRQREDWAPINEWQVQSARDIGMLVPRLLKHMVVKAQHWQNLYVLWQNNRGKTLTETEVEQLKQFSRESRKQAGPLKHKKHPTWAWTCGFLEGDGCFTFKVHPSGYGKKLSISATAHKDDCVSIELLHKAFGGAIYPSSTKTCMVWKRNLGVSDASFAFKFLSKLVQHAHLKKHKMEQMLAYLHSHTGLQRLTEDNPTG
jgi:hypothetical protein